MEQDLTQELQSRIKEASETRRPMMIRGGGTKSFLNPVSRDDLIPLNVSGHSGIIHYDPHELVLTARSGTTLENIEEALDQNGQMLSFEPPHFGTGATLGGTIACNLSGPRRLYAGAARDMVLGVRMINGRGEILRFGGEVMKNVAGYDVSRLMAGAMGTLGVLLDVSLKVLPKTAASATVVHRSQADHALLDMNEKAGTPLPVSASCYHEGNLYYRLEGAESAVNSSIKKLGGDLLPGADDFWQGIREQHHAFFNSDGTLWRLSVNPSAPATALDGRWLYEWSGAQRWFMDGDDDHARIRDLAVTAGGHATQFKRPDNSISIFHPPAPELMEIHVRLKEAFDPGRILNPGRLFPGL